MAKYWTRALPVERSPENIFPPSKPKARKIFVPQPEHLAGRTSMSLLLGWEYGRMWLIERDKFVRETTIKSKPRFIKPDLQRWLTKRAIVHDRRQLFHIRQQSQTSSQKKRHTDPSIAELKTAETKKEARSA